MTLSDDEQRAFFAKPIKAPRPKQRSTSTSAGAGADAGDAPTKSNKKQQRNSSLSPPPPAQAALPTHKRITLSSSDEASETEQLTKSTRRKVFGGLKGAAESGGEMVRKLAIAKGWRDTSSEKDGELVATTSKLHPASRQPAKPALQESALKKAINSKSVTNAPQASLSPLPAAQQQKPAPIVAQNFWGAAPAPVAKPAPKVPFAESKRLASLSTIGKQVARPRDEEEDEIDILDEVEELRHVVGGNGNYVTHEASLKQKKAAQLLLLKEKRQIKQVVTPVQKPARLFPTTLADSEQCAFCNKMFTASKLAAHGEECFTRQAQAQSKSRSPPPLARQPAPAAASKFRPAGTGAKAAFPPPAAPAPPPKAKDKGKGQDFLIIDDDDDEEEEEEVTGVGEKVVPQRKRPAEEEEDYFEDDFPDWEEFDEPATRPAAAAAITPAEKKRLDKGKGRAVAPPTKSRRIVIDLEDDDIEVDHYDDAPLANSSKVNIDRLPGPPTDSSPPKASLYLSTLPRALKLGYDHLYTTKAPRGRANADEDDPPQKMSAPAKKSYGRGGFKGRRGRGGARRGARK